MAHAEDMGRRRFYAHENPSGLTPHGFCLLWEPWLIWTHALSNAATGFSGLVQLARATGRHPQIVRNEAMLATEDLVVLTPERGSTDMTDVLNDPSAAAMLADQSRFKISGFSRAQELEAEAGGVLDVLRQRRAVGEEDGVELRGLGLQRQILRHHRRRRHRARPGRRGSRPTPSPS